MFTQVFEVHSHGTRSMNKFYVNNLVTSKSGFSLIFRGAKLWNSLNENIKNSNLNEFKRLLKNEFFFKYDFNDRFNRMLS